MHNLMGNNPIPHLWFLLTTPTDASSKGVMVSLTSLRNAQDQTLVLNPSDHPFIVKTSCVYYAEALIVDTLLIQNRLRDGQIRSHRPCSPGLLKLLRDGLTSSPFTPKKILSFYRAAIAASG